MFGHKFYHSTLRKYVIMIGNMFNDIEVARTDSSGNIVQTIAVPIAYGPKQKWLARVTAFPDFNDQKFAVTLPRIGFEMTSLNYAPERRLNSLQNHYKLSATDSKALKAMYSPVPYDIEFSVYILVKNAEDGTQILEQILPFFTPEFMSTMRLIPEMDLSLDVPTILTSVSSEDVYDGNFEERRALTWQLDFTVKGYVFPPVRDRSGLIKSSTINLNIPNIAFDNQTVTTGISNNVISNTEPLGNVFTRPALKADGTPTSNAALSVPISQIDADDDFGFSTSITENI